MRYVHTNIIAADWRRLSSFYQKVFACKPTGAQRDLSGQWIEQLTGIKDVELTGQHLTLPGYDGTGPTLEIFSYVCLKGLWRYGDWYLCLCKGPGGEFS